MPSEQFYWIDANGNETALSGSPNFDILVGPTGRFMPPIDLVEQQVPFQAGTRLKQTYVKSRDIDLPLGITGVSKSDLRTQTRNLLNMFNPLLGDGQLKIIAEDGSQRLINCRYSSGLEIQETGLLWQNVIIVLKAFDPYWYDPNPIVQTFTVGTPATFFPILPMRLTSSTVFADTTINNEGDVESWPTWIITGPGDTIYIRNLTTGEFININYTLQPGETIYIDTRLGKKTVTLGDGTNLYPNLSSDSSLWALQSGNNQIRIEMQNSQVASSVQLSYQNRYWGA
jgi:phage-related protein